MLIWSLQNDKRFAKHVLLGWVIGIKSLKYLVLCHNLILFGTARNRPRPHRRAHFFMTEAGRDKYEYCIILRLWVIVIYAIRYFRAKL